MRRTFAHHIGINPVDYRARFGRNYGTASDRESVMSEGAAEGVQTPNRSGSIKRKQEETAHTVHGY